MAAHVHAALMLQYAQDAAETDRPWERWEQQVSESGWAPLVTHPQWSRYDEYRRKPRTHIVNGFEVPEPMREAPVIGANVWLSDPVSEDFVAQLSWCANSWRRRHLSRGLVHATKEAAIANAKAMCGVRP